MKPQFEPRAALSILFFAASLLCAAQRDLKPILLLSLDAQIGKGLVLAAQLNHTSARDEAAKAEGDLKEHVGPAVAAAKGNADLTKAVKEYYVTAIAYFDSLDEQKLAALDEKITALQLEYQLAGGKMP